MIDPQLVGEILDGTGGLDGRLSVFMALIQLSLNTSLP